MKTFIFSIALFIGSWLQAQNLNIHKTNGDVITIAVDTIDSITFSNKIRSIDDFCNVKPVGWTCKMYEGIFTSITIPRGNNGQLEDPLLVVNYTNDTLTCSGLYLYVYDISKKESLEAIIAASRLYSWCIPDYFGENEKYFVITTPCSLSNGCWTQDNLRPLFQAIKGLFDKSIIN